MIDLHFWPTPNGLKITLLLEETGLPYTIKPVNIGRGDQFKPEFLAISPNNRMPAIVDHEPVGGGAPLAIFESGAILIYLAEKSGRFLPSDTRGRFEVLQWLMWQMGGLGPMMGQAGHFAVYAPEKIPYAIDRYLKETHRLLGVLDKRLSDRAFIAGEYSIADIACWPWVRGAARLGPLLDEFAHVKRWIDEVGARPAVQRGAAVTVDMPPAQQPMDDEAKKILFGQTARK